MDHDVVVRQKMTERYLLDELEPEARDQFEEHFFDCPECAFDVRAGSQFVTQSKVVLAENPVTARRETSKPEGHAWFSWFRPAFAVPAMALLLAVVAYQNLVTYPKLKAALNTPQVPVLASLNLATYGSVQAVAAPAGKSVILLVRIPQDEDYVRFEGELYNPAGKLDSPFAFPLIAGQDRYPLVVPGANREAGTYRIVVRGFTAAGEKKELGSTSFALQILQ